MNTISPEPEALQCLEVRGGNTVTNEVINAANIAIAIYAIHLAARHRVEAPAGSRTSPLRVHPAANWSSVYAVPARLA